MVLSLSSEVYTKTIRNFILKRILNGEIKKKLRKCSIFRDEHGDQGWWQGWDDLCEALIGREADGSRWRPSFNLWYWRYYYFGSSYIKPHIFAEDKDTRKIWQHAFLCDGLIKSFELLYYLCKTIKACDTILIASGLLGTQIESCKPWTATSRRYDFVTQNDVSFCIIWLFLGFGPQMLALWNSLILDCFEHIQLQLSDSCSGTSKLQISVVLSSMVD